MGEVKQKKSAKSSKMSRFCILRCLQNCCIEILQLGGPWGWKLGGLGGRLLKGSSKPYAAARKWGAIGAPKFLVYIYIYI